LHDDLLAGTTGRSVNGVAGLLVIVLAFTGMVVWWPGIQTWRRSLIVHRNVGWRRFTWDLHSMIGFWTLGFIVLFGISGAYLGNPEAFQDIVDRLDLPPPPTPATASVDQVISLAAYLHFGRINGIGIPAAVPGSATRRRSSFGLSPDSAPAAMFVTGTGVMWWNRAVWKVQANLTVVRRFTQLIPKHILLRQKTQNRAGVIEPQEEEDESAERAIDRRGGLGVLQIYPERHFEIWKRPVAALGSNEQSPRRLSDCGGENLYRKRKQNKGRGGAHNPSEEHDFWMKVFQTRGSRERYARLMTYTTAMMMKNSRSDAEHHDNFHDLAANEPAVSAAAEHTMENEPHRAKRGAPAEETR
jgi:hypothetical protein